MRGGHCLEVVVNTGLTVHCTHLRFMSLRCNCCLQRQLINGDRSRRLVDRIRRRRRRRCHALLSGRHVVGGGERIRSSSRNRRSRRRRSQDHRLQNLLGEQRLVLVLRVHVGHHRVERVGTHR